MSNIWNGDASRRDFLKLAAAAGAAGTGALSLDAAAQAGQPINFYTWSAAVDLVKSHLTAFESSTGLKVNYNNAPWAQYRDTMVTKFVGKAPLDVMWVSDSWLPEWAEAGWIAPIDGFPSLMKYNADADTFCNESMRYKGKQYGLTYYSDYMAFFYDESKLKKAGIAAPTDNRLEGDREALLEELRAERDAAAKVAGAAAQEIIDGWAARLSRMTRLKAELGPEYSDFCNELLANLRSDSHEKRQNVRFVVAKKSGTGLANTLQQI